MCAPGCIEHVAAALSRRALLQSTAAAVAGTGAGTVLATAAGPAAAQQARFPAFSRALDLTHTLTPEFPTFGGAPGLSVRSVKTFKPDGYNLNEWRVAEHSGTHIDAPIHFSASGPGPAELAIELAPTIRVNAVAPGNIDTPMNQELYDKFGGREAFRVQYPMGRIGLEEDVASAVTYLVSDEAEWITGVIMPVDGGYMAK